MKDCDNLIDEFAQLARLYFEWCSLHGREPIPTIKPVQEHVNWMGERLSSGVPIEDIFYLPF